jgi:hypothetical protein
VHSSPHAREILESGDRLGADIIAATDQRYRSLVVATIEGAAGRDELDLDRANLTPELLGTLLMRAVEGLTERASSRTELTDQLRGFVRLILHGVRPRSGRGSARGSKADRH